MFNWEKLCRLALKKNQAKAIQITKHRLSFKKPVDWEGLNGKEALFPV